MPHRAPQNAPTGSGRFAWPTQGILTQRYWSGHLGIDIGNRTGTPIRAADAGYVVLAGVVQLHDLEQTGQFFQAGQHGHLFGHDAIQATVGKDRSQVPFQAAQVFFRLGENVDFLAPKVVDDGHRLRAQIHVERVGQAVGRVGAQDDGPVAQVGAAQGSGGGGAGLAHPTLAGIEQYACVVFHGDPLCRLCAGGLAGWFGRWPLTFLYTDNTGIGFEV